MSHHRQSTAAAVAALTKASAISFEHLSCVGTTMAATMYPPQLKRRISEWDLTVSEASEDQLISSCTVRDMELVSAGYWATGLQSVL